MNTGDTAWVLVSSALVLLMTPALAFFYGGMVRSKSVLNMLMMNFVTIGIVSLLWVLYGFSAAFGNTGNGLWGGLQWAGMKDLTTVGTTLNGSVYGIPLLVFAAFQLMFAVITPALISGAIADRAKFGAWMVFVALWVTIVYFPVAHWVFDFGDAKGNGAGWLAHMGVLDFAGGTAVHVNAGAAGLALALVLGKRVGWKRDPMRPHNLTLVMLGAGLLWFGWFGFNAGSALGANNTAAVTWVNTMVATAAAAIGWLATERFRDGHATSLGAASGIVAGLVAITPSCSSVTPVGAIAIGVIAGVVCALAVGLKFRLGFDDSLDVVGVHLVGGVVGTLAIGFFASASAPAGVDGLFYGGGVDQLWRQAIGAFSVLAFSFVLTYAIGTVLAKVLGFRVERDAEVAGIDLDQHAETSYDLGTLSGGSRFGGSPPAPGAAAATPQTATTTQGAPA
jgi:Amt family ammonium transporter